MAENPQISFIIPCHNEAKYIKICIESIKKQQTSYTSEIIVIDNLSTDNTGQIAIESGVRIEKEKKLGLSFARAKGLKSSKGKILIFVDADTVLPSNWTSIAIRFLSKNNNVVAVSSGFSFYDGRFFENIGCFFMNLFNPMYNALFQLFGKPHLILGQSFAVKKSALLTAGGINMDFPFYAEDIAMALRLNSIGSVRYLSSIKAHTSARRYHNVGVFKTLYYYMIPMFLLMFGNYDHAKKIASSQRYQK